MHAWLGFIPIRWLVLVHVASAMGLLLAHGGSAAAMLRMRKERDVERVKALLEMSQAAVGAMWTVLGALGISGILLMLVEHTAPRTWAWGSIVVFVLLSGSMSFLGSRPFNRIRHAAGLPYFDGKRMTPAGPVDRAAFDREMAKLKPALTTAIGLVGYGLILYLMVMRPA
jgi:hypothetical protein